MHDIIIVGGGMAGLALACMLAQKTSLSIAVLEAATAIPGSHRVSAISLASQKIFQSMNVWQDIHGPSPFRQIMVWDAAGKGEILFDSAEITESLLGYIVTNQSIQMALADKARCYSQIEIIAPVKLMQMVEHHTAIELLTDDQRIFKAKLVIAADGAHSWLRQKAGIGVEKFDYHQQAIVATVKTTLPHHQVARQVFLDSGPLAFLPLNEPHTCSIVWSLPNEQAEQWLKLDTLAFQQALGQAFEYRLGEVVEVDKRYVFPLSRQKAASYIKPHLALVGDAAHTVHPLAGQGLNMGLLDAASLTAVIVDAIQQQRDFSSFATLRAYERWRKADNLLMCAGIDVIKHLFASDRKSIQHMRSFGLNAVNRIRWIKNIFARHAVG